MPHLERVTIDAIPILKSGKPIDAGNILGPLKAAVDGLRDVGVIDDDSPKYVEWVRIWGSQRGDRDAMKLVIRRA